MTDQGQKLLFVRFPACFDSSFAGNGVEHFIPNGGFVLPASHQKVGGKCFHSIGGVLFGKIHRDGTQDDGVFTQRVDLKAQFFQKGLICQERAAACRVQTAGDRGEKGLTGNGLLIGFKLIK